MAKSKYEYVKDYESFDSCTPNCWIIIQVEKKDFNEFSKKHNFLKPHDESVLKLMNKCANNILEEFKDITISLGNSSEFNFVFRKETEEFQRRRSKLLSTLVSCFSSSYTFYWSEIFADRPLMYPATFDGRLFVCPSDGDVRDYLSWRQDIYHHNNLHDICFWRLVKDMEISEEDASKKLEGMTTGDKNDLLFIQFNVNYNNTPEMFRKGSVVVRAPIDESAKNSVRALKKRSHVLTLHCSLMRDDFWSERPFLLSNKS